MAELSSNALRLGGLAQNAVALAFEIYAEAVVAGSYCRTNHQSASVSMLVMPVPTAKVDGITIKPGDELVLVQAADLAAVVQPRAGDYLVETTSNLRRDVVVAQLDLARQVWSLVGRKVFEEIA